MSIVRVNNAFVEYKGGRYPVYQVYGVFFCIASKICKYYDSEVKYGVLVKYEGNGEYSVGKVEDNTLEKQIMSTFNLSVDQVGVSSKGTLKFNKRYVKSDLEYLQTFHKVPLDEVLERDLKITKLEEELLKVKSDLEKAYEEKSAILNLIMEEGDKDLYYKACSL